MKPVIQKLLIKRFRSIPHAIVEFSNPTFLVGKNGSGKSNLVDVFSFLSEAMSSPLQAVFDRRGGIQNVRYRASNSGGFPGNMGLSVVFGSINGSVKEARYAFELRSSANHVFEVCREQGAILLVNGERHWFERSVEHGFESSLRNLKPSLEPTALGLPVIGGEERFSPIVKALSGMKAYSIDPVKLRDFQDPDSGLGLKRDGSNVASVLQEIERTDKGLERICQFLEAIVPNTRKVSPVKHGNKLTLEFKQEWGEGKSLIFEAFNMSDGTLRALGLLAAIYQRPTPNLVAIEEPEATLHPGALGAVLDLLQFAGQKLQVVVTTHSPEVLDAKWIGADNLRIVEWVEGATQVTKLSQASQDAIRDHLMGAGELLRSNALRASEPPVPLFVDMAAFDSELFPKLA